MYATDLRQLGERGVELLRIEPSGHPLIEYPIAVTSTARDPSLAQEFVDFATGPTAQAILSEAGFTSVE